jgi:hypothetical protein
MLKILIAKQNVLASSVLLIACLAYIHEGAAAQQDRSGTADPHEEARVVLQWGTITQSSHNQALTAVDAVRSVYLDPNEQARRLLSRPIPAAPRGPAFAGSLLIVNSQEVDAHKGVERLLSAPLPN